MILECFIVFVLAMLAGLWATAAGVFKELDPSAVLLVAIAGSFTFTLVVLFVGGSWRDKLVATCMPDADERVAGSKLSAVLNRYGVPGFAFASIIFGPGLTLAGVLTLGVDRRRFFLWYAPDHGGRIRHLHSILGVRGVMRAHLDHELRGVRQ